jgi:hypothetical protein
VAWQGKARLTYIKEDTMQQETIRKVTLSGISDIMFDKYAGDNKTELPVEKKLYFMPDGKSVMLPSANILSFLSALNTDSAPKRFMDSREYKKVAAAFLSYTAITPFSIPFMREGKNIQFKGFENDIDKTSGIYVHRSVARLAKGIPNPKIRPVVPLPWQLSFNIMIYQNNDFNEELLSSMFIRGGMAIGLGTYRGIYGKFEVVEWK